MKTTLVIAFLLLSPSVLLPTAQATSLWQDTRGCAAMARMSNPPLPGIGMAWTIALTVVNYVGCFFTGLAVNGHA